MEIKKSVLGSIRLDSDIWEALRKLPESPNKFLRKVLSANGAFQSQVIPPENLIFSKKPITNYRREIRSKGDGKR